MVFLNVLSWCRGLYSFVAYKLIQIKWRARIAVEIESNRNKKSTTS